MTDPVEILLHATDRASGTIHSVSGALGTLGRTGVGHLTPLSNLITTIGANLVSQTITNGLRALTGGIKDTFDTSVGFEQKLADIDAIMGLTGDESERLGGLIKELGLDPNLKVSAVQAAAAVEMLGKNGLSLDEIMQGATKSAVLLANATNDDFAMAADVATDVMQQFNISAKDMNKAVDQIIGTTQASKLDINGYRLAIGMAGGVAGSVGVEFDDFNATLAAIAPNFSSGSDLGTSFKTMLQRLVPQSLEAAKTMRNLGLYTGLTDKEFEKTQEKIEKVNEKIAKLDPTSKNYATRVLELQNELNALNRSLTKGNSAFFDAEGNMRSMGEIATALQGAFGDLTEEQRIEAASTIFGTDSMRAALGLMEAGGATIESYKAKIGNVSAEEAAAKRMDTLKGAMEIFGGVIETLQITVGEKFIPMFTDMTRAATTFLMEHQDSIVAWFTNVADAIGYLWSNREHLLMIFGDGSNVIGRFLEKLGMSEDAADLFGGTIARIIGFVVDELPKWRTNWDEWATAAWKWIEDTAIPKVVEWLGALWITFSEWVADNTPGWITSFGSWALAVWTWIQDDVIPNVTEWLGTLWTTFQGWIDDNTPLWLENFTTWAENAWKWIEDTVIPKVVEWLDTLWTTFKDWVDNNTPLWLGYMEIWAADTWEWIRDTAVPKTLEWLGALWTTFSAWFSTNLPTWITNMETWATKSWEWLRDEVVPHAKAQLFRWWAEFRSWWDENWPTWKTNMETWAAKSWEWLRDDVLPNVRKYMGEWAAELTEPDKPGGKIVKWFETTFPQSISATKTAWETFVARYNELARVLSQNNHELELSFQQMTTNIGDYFKRWGEVFAHTFDVIDFIVASFINWLSDATGHLIGVVQFFAQMAKSDWAGALTTLLGITPEAKQAVADLNFSQIFADMNAALNANLNAATGGTGSAGPQYITPLPATTNNFNIYLQGSGSPANDIYSTVGTLQMMYATP